LSAIGLVARALSLLFAIALVGCDTYTPPPAPQDPDPTPADPLEARIRARAPTEAPYMIRQGEARHFTVSPSQSASYMAVLPSGLCYKVIAQGADGTGEVDLFLYRANGVLVQQDTTSGTGAILGTTRPICPEDPAEYRIELRASGSGEVVTQLYASP
jgi:hypothetical protein